MTLLKEILKLIPRGLLTETAGDDEDLIKHILMLYKHDPTSPHVKKMVRLFMVSQRASHGEINPELLAIAKSMGIKLKPPKVNEEKLKADVYDTLVKRFERGFSIDQIASMMRVKQVEPGEQEEIFDEILSNKDVVIRRALWYLKEDDLSSLIQLMFYARKYGYDYSEFKTIEKSMPKLKEWGGGGKSADRGSDRGYRDDDDMQFITRRKGKKVQKNIIVKESYSVVDTEMGDDDDEMYFYVQNDGEFYNHQGDNAENRPQIGIKFNALGHFDGIFSIDKSILARHRKEIIEAILDDLGLNDVSKHEIFIKQLLTHIKQGVPHRLIALLIFQARDKGYDYPEFKAIEKSIGHSLSESEMPRFTSSDIRFVQEFDGDPGEIWITVQSSMTGRGYNGVSIIFSGNGTIDHLTCDDKSHNEWDEYGKEIIKVAQKGIDDYFSNKKEFIKKLLVRLKKGDNELVKGYIRLAKKRGYNYSEFKIIEKSIQGYN